MRLAPKSLAGRLTLLLLIALAIAQGVAMILFTRERIEAVRHAHKDNVILRTATVARLLRDTPPAFHGAVVVAASTDFSRYSLTDTPLVGRDGAGVRANAIAARLSVALETDRDRVMVAPMWSRHRHHDDGDDEDDEDDEDDWDDGKQHKNGHHGGDHDHGPRHRRPLWFTASAALDDGRWLNVEVGPPPGAPPWGRTFVLSFMLSALGIAVVAVLTGRRIAKPMRRLAAAAGKLGRGEAVEDLPEAGPLETRDTVRAFNVMRERLDRFVRDRTAMLAAVSHDLRTPITSLRLHAEMIDNEETRSKIIAALDEMQRMTEDTLAFIREDMQREGTRTVDLHALVDSVATDLADLGHEIAVADSDRILVSCRTVGLRRALRNLMENACRYGDRATVRIVPGDSQVRIVVEDEGPGVPEAELERVFEPFVRLEASRSPETGGTGLGLAIARSIVRGHGGDIRLENRQAGGLLATVTLPADGQG
ncbi:MAG: ATP-binding protein [Gammaproteobacteria bacterium]|nr:ATP-binding protein [Gammaproteobacteria bacterium]